MPKYDNETGEPIQYSKWDLWQKGLLNPEESPVVKAAERAKEETKKEKVRRDTEGNRVYTRSELREMRQKHPKQYRRQQKSIMEAYASGRVLNE